MILGSAGSIARSLGPVASSGSAVAAAIQGARNPLRFPAVTHYHQIEGAVRGEGQPPGALVGADSAAGVIPAYPAIDGLVNSQPERASVERAGRRRAGRVDQNVGVRRVTRRAPVLTYPGVAAIGA